MAKIEVLGVAHIDSETVRVSDALRDRLTPSSLTFLEPTPEILREPDSLVVYQRGFWRAIRDLAADNSNGVVPISHERMPRIHPGSYLNMPTGMPETRYGVGLILEEKLQADWIDRKMEKSDHGIVVIGNAHAVDIVGHLSERGHEAEYVAVNGVPIPETRYYREVKDFVSGERQDCVRLSWKRRATDYLIKKVEEFYREQGVPIFGNPFNTIMSNPDLVQTFYDFCHDLLTSPELQPTDDEKLYGGCSLGNTLQTHGMMIEMMNINPIRNHLPPTLTKADF